MDEGGRSGELYANVCISVHQSIHVHRRYIHAQKSPLRQVKDSLSSPPICPLTMEDRADPHFSVTYTQEK